jgi:2-phosphoglycerate kinase
MSRMSDRRPPESPVVSPDVRLPYSKGLMAKSLMGTGLTPERSYELARLIETELIRTSEEASATQEHVYEVAANVLGEHEDEHAVRRLRRFQALQEVDLPLIVLVGGATGTGKSTITTEVAHRLGITRVTSTDFVRQTMRAFFSEAFMPSIHYSSFDAGAAVDATANERRDANIRGFLEQTRNVLVGVRAVIDRALTESHSMALEGVHVVPGSVPAALEGAIVSQCLIAISDETEHARHFYVRDADSEGLRPVDKYLNALPEIRKIQDYLVARAEEAGVPVIENSDREHAVDAVIRLVLDSFDRAVVAA